MEAIAEKLNNIISHSKESIPITITGRVINKDGTFIEQLEEPLRLDEAANYHVYLNDFTGWSNVPNVNETNNKFYYKFNPPGKERTSQAPGTVMLEQGPVIFPVSTQSVDTYNYFLESVFTKRDQFTVDPGKPENKIFPVKFTYDLTVMRVIMHVAKYAHVDFKDDTWYKELGFKTGGYTEGVYLAPNIADIEKSLNILIKTNLSLDWRFKGKRTNILYNISNSVPAGQQIVEKPNPVKRVVLANKDFHEIRVQFETEDGVAVDFNGEESVMTLVIKRM